MPDDTSDAAMLARVRSAIADLLDGRAASVKVNGEEVAYHSISDLRVLEQMYVRRISTAARSASGASGGFQPYQYKRRH